MVEHDDITPTTDEIDDPLAQKQAACLACRKSKVRCIRSIGSDACKRCMSAGVECVVPEYHVGRYKGVKNKRSGLEKAIYQVEEAVKKARTSSGGLDTEHARALQRLLDDSKVSSPLPRLQTSDQASVNSNSPSITRTQPIRSSADLWPGQVNKPSFPDRNMSFARPEHNGEATVNNADNPLQLLAIASAIPESAADIVSPSTTSRVSPDNGTTSAVDDEIQNFFSSMSSRPDNLSEWDPIDQGLVTVEESTILFNYFHSNLSHTRWGLDEIIHTPNFVRSRSAYLFTSIMAASALFLPTTGALSMRLNNHVKYLAHQVITKGYKSVEIVLAYMLNIPWMLPGKNWAMDDETCYYLSTALTIALDLSLNKIIVPSSTMRPPGVMDRIAHSDCIEAQRALNMDGHSNIDIGSDYARRLLRTRERTWLALFTLDRGVCLARGRPWTVPVGPLIDTCDAWHVNDTACRWDGSLVASTVLRRNFGDLVNSIRNICDNNQLTFALGDGSNMVKVMKEKIEGFFQEWYNTWSFQIKQKDGSMPPYVSILVSHGKLSAYARVINHPTASPEVKQFFRTAGLASALNTMSTVVQAEHSLKSLPNNSTIMVAFAACFVLGLSTVRRGEHIYIAPHARQSIEETANVLERIGSEPTHRKGASALFGKHIKRILRLHTSMGQIGQPLTKENSAQHLGTPFPGSNYVATPYMLQSTLGTTQNEFPGFDSMTDEQLIHAIQNAKNGVDAFNVGLQPDENLFMDWLEWPNMTW